MSERDQNLEVIAPPKRGVVVRGETLVVSPLTLEQLPAFIGASRPLIGRVIIAMSLAGAGAQIEMGALLLDILEQDAQAFAKAAAVVTGRAEAWLAGAAVGEIAELAEAIVAVNADFFARRLPALMGAGQAAIRAARREPAPDGPTSSTSSSPEATSGAT